MKVENMSDDLPPRCPACAIRILDRRAWFHIPGLVSAARLAKARGLSRILSSKRLAGQEIAAIALGSTIYFRRIDQFNPHTVAGLAFLAHELKHVEQYKRDGMLKFLLRYAWDFIIHRGYSEKLRYEAEATHFQQQVAAHLTREFANNSGQSPCQELAEPHTINDNFLVEDPNPFQFPV
jgi:hypothetical protein